MYRPRSLARLLADCHVIQYTLTCTIFATTPLPPIQHLYGTPYFTCMVSKKKVSPQHDGRLKERMNDRSYKFPCKIESIPTPKYFISRRL